MQNLSRILSSINDAVWSFDLIKNQFIFLNTKVAALYETSLENLELCPDFWMAYVHPDDRTAVINQSRKALKGDSIEMEYRILINDKTKWILEKQVAVLDADGNPEIITSIISDITARKEADLQLSDTKKLYRYLFINNPNPLWIYDRSSLKFLAVNNAAISKYGYSSEEFLSMTIKDIRPPEDVSELLRHVKAVTSSFSNPKRAWRHLKKNGEIVYVNISGHGISYEGHDAELVMAHDVTIEVESRNKIAIAKENLDALINNISEDIWSIDASYNLLFANQSFISNKERNGLFIETGSSIFSYERDESERKQWKAYYDKALNGESFSFIEFKNLPNRQPYCIEVKMSPIRNGGQIIGVACISNNIQDRFDEHERILEQNKNLREVISIASHDIRGPVATILGLINAFNKANPNDPFNFQIMQLITETAKNLDLVLHKLVDKSYALKEERKLTKNARYSRSTSELP